jgi:hypothetical protein
MAQGAGGVTQKGREKNEEKRLTAVGLGRRLAES